MNAKGKTLALTGAWLQLVPLFGLIGTAIGMIAAFQTIGEGGMGKSEALAEDIHFVLISTAISLIIGLVGLILMLIALFKYKYNEKWFFWFLIVISALMLPRFPAGTFIGAGLLIYLITHRNEFKIKTEPERGADTV